MELWQTLYLMLLPQPSYYSTTIDFKLNAIQTKLDHVEHDFPFDNVDNCLLQL